MRYIILILIKLYQKTLSCIFRYTNPFWGCRFFPTCSEYSYRAIKRHGLIKGAWKSIKRIIRCHPLNKGGYDPE